MSRSWKIFNISHRSKKKRFRLFLKDLNLSFEKISSRQLSEICTLYTPCLSNQSINQPSNYSGVRRLWSKNGVRRLWGIPSYCWPNVLNLNFFPQREDPTRGIKYKNSTTVVYWPQLRANRARTFTAMISLPAKFRSWVFVQWNRSSLSYREVFFSVWEKSAETHTGHRTTI